MMTSKEFRISSRERVESVHGFGWELGPDGDDIGIAIQYFEIDGSRPRGAELISSNAIPCVLESLARLTMVNFPEEIDGLVEALTSALSAAKAVQSTCSDTKGETNE